MFLRKKRSTFDLIALDRLATRTQTRLDAAQESRTRASTAEAFEGYNSDLRYFEDVLVLIEEARSV